MSLFCCLFLLKFRTEFLFLNHFPKLFLKYGIFKDFRWKNRNRENFQFSEDGKSETRDGRFKTSCYPENCPCLNDTIMQKSNSPSRRSNAMKFRRAILVGRAACCDFAQKRQKTMFAAAESSAPVIVWLNNIVPKEGLLFRKGETLKTARFADWKEISLRTFY